MPDKVHSQLWHRKPNPDFGNNPGEPEFIFTPSGEKEPLPTTGTVVGTWDYAAGTSGTVTLTGNKLVTGISAVALGASGTITINGGDEILLPYDPTDRISTAHEFNPRGQLVDPEIVFTGTSSYFVQYVVP